MNRILLVDKPAGWTSFDVVATLRGALKAHYARQNIRPTKRQLKIGHAGTLDPFATGLLVILVGDATRMADEFLRHDKEYEFVVQLGATSSTGDTEGDITTNHQANVPTRRALDDVLRSLSGRITQRPPVYSAIKINGTRAYVRSRRGEEVDMPLREVTIHSLQCLDYNYPIVRLRARVSSGTYIRSLAESIGEMLGTGAYTEQLRRISCGAYHLDDAISVVEAREVIENLAQEDQPQNP